MNWAALAAIVSLLGLVVTIVGVAYTSGQLTQQIRDGASKTEDHANTLIAHAGKINEHEVKIGKIEEWKAGVRIGARLPPEREVQ